MLEVAQDHVLVSQGDERRDDHRGSGATLVTSVHDDLAGHGCDIHEARPL